MKAEDEVKVYILRANLNFLNFKYDQVYFGKVGEEGIIHVCCGENAVSFSVNDATLIKGFDLIETFTFTSKEGADTFVKNGLDYVFVMVNYINELFEEQEALYDLVKREVILFGDYYHDKIGYIIDGFIDGLSHTGSPYSFKEEKINPNHAIFEELGFNKE